jgi:ketosteroid isomerase-like protein
LAEESVDLVRRMLEAFNAQDPDTALALMDENIEWHPPADEPDSAVHGPAGVAGFVLQWLASFDEFRSHPQRYIDGGDCIVVPIRYSGRMRGSGAELALDETMVAWVRDAKIVEVRSFRTTDEALEAAGMGADT